jgi:hypothetical protein
MTDVHDRLEEMLGDEADLRWQEHTRDTLEQLSCEVAELRRELTALRDSLAVEVRTRRILVAEGERDVEIIPGEVSVSDDRNGCHAVLGAHEEYAEMHVSACDVVGDRFNNETQLVSMIAWVERDVEPGGPHAEVTVNSVELPVPAAASG